MFYDRFQKITREYESKLHWCTASGFHGNLEDVNEEKLGTTSPSIQYLHCYMKMNPELFSVSLCPANPSTTIPLIHINTKIVELGAYTHQLCVIFTFEVKGAAEDSLLGSQPPEGHFNSHPQL